MWVVSYVGMLGYVGVCVGIYTSLVIIIVIVSYIYIDSYNYIYIDSYN